MIDIDIWIGSIASICKHLSDGDVDESINTLSPVNTSITSISELYEQVFDDLNSDSQIQILDSKIDPDLRGKINYFLDSLRKVDEISQVISLNDSQVIKTAEWSRLKSAADQLSSDPIAYDFVRKLQLRLDART